MCNFTAGNCNSRYFIYDFYLSDKMLRAAATAAAAHIHNRPLNINTCSTQAGRKSEAFTHSKACPEKSLNKLWGRIVSEILSILYLHKETWKHNDNENHIREPRWHATPLQSGPQKFIYLFNLPSGVNSLILRSSN